VPTGGEVGPGPRGFSIGESELGISASIDPMFSGQLTTSFAADNSLGVEEAWFQGAAWSRAASLRVGPLLSGIGYLNEHHAHTWDFIDAPLVYQAFFGGPIKTDGLQMRWVAPTDRFLEIGAEIGSGRRFPAAAAAATASARERSSRTSATTSARARAGASASRCSATAPTIAATTTSTAPAFRHQQLQRTNRTWGVDGIYKWAPDGNARQRNFILQGEFFQRTRAER
jgi:hypothetical protein